MEVKKDLKQGPRCQSCNEGLLYTMIMNIYQDVQQVCNFFWLFQRTNTRICKSFDFCGSVLAIVDPRDGSDFAGGKLAWTSLVEGPQSFLRASLIDVPDP